MGPLNETQNPADVGATEFQTQWPQQAPATHGEPGPQGHLSPVVSYPFVLVDFLLLRENT